jgi:hypothetical protein
MPWPTLRWLPPRDWPWEPGLKILLGAMGAVVEVYAKNFVGAYLSDNYSNMYYRPVFQADGRFSTHLPVWDHLVMYMCFVFIGCTELYGICLSRCRPDDAITIGLAQVAALAATALGWGLISVSLLFHASAQEGVEALAHLLLGLYAGAASMVAMFEAAAKPVGGAHIAPVVRSGFVILQGTWWLQIAAMHLRQDVWFDDIRAHHAIPVVMGFHVLAVAFFLLGLFVVFGLISPLHTYCCARCCPGRRCAAHRYKHENAQLLKDADGFPGAPDIPEVAEGEHA